MIIKLDDYDYDYENFISNNCRTAEKESKNFVCDLYWIEIEPLVETRLTKS